jgi:hypothetical protein
MGDLIGSRWLRAAVAMLLAAAAVGAQPGVALGDPELPAWKCAPEGYVSPPYNLYNYWYAGQCLEFDSSQWNAPRGIDGYVRLSTPAWPPDPTGIDRELNDWLGVGDSGDSNGANGYWVQAGLHSEYGKFAIYYGVSIRAGEYPNCTLKRIDTPMSLAKPNHAVYVYAEAYTYSDCLGTSAWRYAVKYDSWYSPVVARGWLRNAATVKAATEYQWLYNVAIGPPAGGQRFGLNNSGAYDPGYAINLWNGSSWVTWSQEPTVHSFWSRKCTNGGKMVATYCETMPRNPYYWSGKHNYNAFTVEYRA